MTWCPICQLWRDDDECPVHDDPGQGGQGGQGGTGGTPA